ncbi:unannotated protein [freshwater metagenome]|uniref:Unannotated protein n=1 Tax=freshwater metagenome TaxID=449393 RepID=A0A6J7MUI3_9ZZZZ
MRSEKGAPNHRKSFNNAPQRRCKFDQRLNDCRGKRMKPLDNRFIACTPVINKRRAVLLYHFKRDTDSVRANRAERTNNSVWSCGSKWSAARRYVAKGAWKAKRLKTSDSPWIPENPSDSCLHRTSVTPSDSKPINILLRCHLDQVSEIAAAAKASARASGLMLPGRPIRTSRLITRSLPHAAPWVNVNRDPTR